MSGRTIVGVIAGGAIFSAGAILGLQSTQQPKGSSEDESTSNISWKQSEKIFKSIAREYDTKIHMDEFFMGMLLLRRYLIRQSHGRTLEVSAGTGRNIRYYDGEKVSQLVCSDMNRDMLLEAASKANISKVPNIQFCIANVEHLTGEIPISESTEESPYGPLLRETTVFEKNQFDTVVDTFGLCSCSDPEQAMHQMVAALKPGTGQLILLEHGKGTWSFVNKILDIQEQEHFQKWGCNFNRDIVEIIEDNPSLEIQELRRWHFGTTVACIARKKSSC